jgi:tRNA threonylcarbamoyladenosine biosynthesis protein TsaE
METFQVNTEDEMLELGNRLATLFQPGMLIYLHGDLGAGKTTLTRGYLQALGYEGIVKSPTYTLVETYLFDDFNVHHFDLYRLKDPQELIWMGFNDYVQDSTICLVEWPDKGEGILPKADMTCHIDISEHGRLVHLNAKPR